MQKYIAELTPCESEQACRDIITSLPEWFGIPEAYERYANGVKERLILGYFIDKVCFVIPMRFTKGTEAPIRLIGMLQKAYKI